MLQSLCESSYFMFYIKMAQTDDALLALLTVVLDSNLGAA